MANSQRDMWATVFVDALTHSHHRDWSEDTIIEVALICADAALKVIASIQEQQDPVQTMPEKPLSHGGYM